MQKEQWINEVMSSLEGLQKDEGNPYLHTRVLAKLQNTTPVRSLSPKPLYALAATVLAVIVLNLFLWNQPFSDNSEQDTTSTVVNEYDLTTIDY